MGKSKGRDAGTSSRGHRPEHARGQLLAEPVTARQPQIPGYCLLINLLIMFCFNPRAWRRCGNVRHLFMPRVAGGVTKAASRRCHRASPGSELLPLPPPTAPLPQFPPQEMGIPGSIPLGRGVLAPQPQCQLSPALSPVLGMSLSPLPNPQCRVVTAQSWP